MGHRLQLIVLLIASSLTLMAAAMVAPALPLMSKHFRDTRNVELLVPLVLTLPGIAIAGCAPLAGLIADKWGRTRLLLMGLALYVAAGASGLVLQSLEAIVLSRIALGVAVACTMTCATALIVDYWEGPARQRALGFQASAAGFGGAFYPIVAGLLAESGWRYPFAGYLLPIPLAVAAYFVLKDVPRATTTEKPERSKFPVSFALGIFVLAFLVMVVLYAIPLRVPFYLRELGYPSPTLAALGIAVPSLGAAITALNARYFRSLFSPLSLVKLAFGAMAAGYSIVALSGTVQGLFVGLVFCGIGFGLNTPNLTAWLQSRMPVDMRARGAGGYTTAVFLGQFSSTFVYAILASSTGFAGTFTAVSLACLAVVGCSFLGNATLALPSAQRPRCYFVAVRQIAARAQLEAGRKSSPW